MLANKKVREVELNVFGVVKMMKVVLWNDNIIVVKIYFFKNQIIGLNTLPFLIRGLKIFLLNSN